MATSPPVVLITVDCLRADHVGFNGYSRPTTPFLDSLAAEGTVFSNAIVAGTPTYYSFPGIMASRYPLALGRDVVGLAPGEPTIATALKDAGYATGAFLAGNPYLSPQFGYDAGFDTFHDFLDAELPPLHDGVATAGTTNLRSRLNRRLDEISHQLGPLGTVYDELYFRYGQRNASPVESMNALRRFPAADRIVDEASAWLAAVGDKPFFLWLHLMDPHAPYYPTEKGLELMGDDISPERARFQNSYWNRALNTDRFTRYLQPITALYDAGIRWVDAQVERLVQTLRRSERWQNCVFALTADHGEQFLDHGDRYHAPTKLTEEVIRVPLLVRVPGQEHATVRAPFSLLHLAPTLLDAARVSVPKDFHGQIGGEAAAVVECVAGCNNPYRAGDRMGARILAVREDRYKLTVDFGSKQVSLFDLERDPRELRPIPEREAKPERHRLLGRARQHLENSQRDVDAGRRLDMRLRDLRLEWSA